MFRMCKNKTDSKGGLKLQKTEISGVFCRLLWHCSVVVLLAFWYILSLNCYCKYRPLTFFRFRAATYWLFIDNGNKYRACKTAERSAVISGLERWAAVSVACTCHRGRRRGRNTWTDRSGFSPPVSCPGWSGPCPHPHASAALKHTRGQTSMCHSSSWVSLHNIPAICWTVDFVLFTAFSHPFLRVV